MLNPSPANTLLQSVTRHKDVSAKPAVKQDTGNAFGSVLSRQIEDKKNALAEKSPADAKSDASPALANSTPETADTLKEQDNVRATDLTANPMAAMLFANQEARTPVAKDLESQTALVTESGIRPVTTRKATIETGTDIDATQPTAHSSKKPESGDHLGSAREKLDPATAAKAEATLSAQPAAKNMTGSETLKTAELSAPHATATHSAQTLSQAASTLVAASLQPNAATNVTSNPVTITAPLGSNAWPDEFSQKVSWISTQQSQIAELHLNPPDLGPMSVVLTIADKQATALFTSPHSAVRDAIENALPKLREILSDNGIMLGNATVSDQAPRDNHSASFMNQHGNSRSESTRAIASEKSEALPLITSRRHNGMVDTFA